MEFKLRPFTINDLDSIVQHANNEKVAKNMTNRFPHPYTEENGKSFIEFATSKAPPHILAIEIDGKAVGAAGIHRQDDIQIKNAELGYWLGESYWGKGIISKVVSQMVDYAFENWDINRLFARPFGPNLASQRVLEKNDFILEARFDKTYFKNGEHLDELVYAVRRDRWTSTTK